MIQMFTIMKEMEGWARDDFLEKEKKRRTTEHEPNISGRLDYRKHPFSHKLVKLFCIEGNGNHAKQQ